MTKITALLVKKLREYTGAGIIDCKKMLTQTNGNIELAIENMQKFCFANAKKSLSNKTCNGVIFTKVKKNSGFILEVNCQTDFVAKNSDFLKFSKKVLDTAIIEKINNIEMLKERLEKERNSLITQFGENINIHRFSVLEGEVIGSYQHHNMRAGVLVAAKNKDTNKELIKKIAMHIAASKPKFIKPENVPPKIKEEIFSNKLNILIKSGLLKDVAEKIAANHVTTFIQETSLISQPFVMDPKKTISDLLKEYNTDIISFIHFEIGEETNAF